MTSEQRPEGGKGVVSADFQERTFPAERTAAAKVPRWEDAWHV